MKLRIKLILGALPFLLPASRIQAEGVEQRSQLPSELTRIRGATSIARTPFGCVTLGGSTLRWLPKGSAQWRALHKVQGDNLYRVAFNDKNQLLAAWEGEAQFHFFLPKEGKHLEFPKPAKPGPAFNTWSLDDIYFNVQGDVIIYMHGMTGSNLWTTVAYWYRLGGAPAKELFRQDCHEMYTSESMAIYAYSKNRSRGCDYNACSPLNGIYAYEIKGDRAIRRILLETNEDKYIIARLYWGSDEKQVALHVYDNKNVRWLLRWVPGQTKVTMRPLEKGPTWEISAHWLMRNGDLIEIFQTADYLNLELWRTSLDGRTEKLTLPIGNRKIYWDTSVYGLKERAKGGLAMQWGSRLIFIDQGKPPRFYDLAPLLKRGNEWGGAFLYQSEPEAAWIGVDLRGGRDYLYVDFAEAEKNAKPL